MSGSALLLYMCIKFKATAWRCFISLWIKSENKEPVSTMISNSLPPTDHSTSQLLADNPHLSEPGLVSFKSCIIAKFWGKVSILTSTELRVNTYSTGTTVQYIANKVPTGLFLKP